MSSDWVNTIIYKPHIHFNSVTFNTVTWETVVNFNQ